MSLDNVNVFLIDDDPDSLRLLEHHFLPYQDDWHISYFCEPRNALAEVASNGQTIVVSDWHMPDTDGLKLCAQIREKVLPENGGFAYFILLTANDDQDDAVTLGEDVAARQAPDEAVGLVVEGAEEDVEVVVVVGDLRLRRQG